MDLDQVRVFTRVAQSGSFTAAARLLGMPKSSVSRRVAELEAALGARLLNRTTRKLSLTDAGRLYFARTARIIEDLEAADRAVLELQAEPRGTLRLTAPSDMAGAALLRALRLFRERYPQVALVLLPTNRRVDLVGEGVDLALRAGPLAESSLVGRRLPVPRLQLYASPGYLERHGTPRTLADLQSHECLVFDADSTARRWQLEGPAGPVDVAVRGSFAANDFGALLHACLEGMGIAMLPGMNVLGEEQSGRLRRVLPDHGGPESLLHAVYPSPSHLTPKVRVLIDFLSEYFAAGCAG
jgi:DNA-binding transcriptional LysR family regulator